MGSNHGPVQRCDLRLGEQQLGHAIAHALAQAGDCLARLVSERLHQAGQDSALHVLIEQGRVVVASRSAALRDAEAGSAETAPCPLMEHAARDSAPLAARALVHALHEQLA